MAKINIKRDGLQDLREGQKQATEVARMARHHKEKGPNHQHSELVPFLYGGTPNLNLNYPLLG